VFLFFLTTQFAQFNLATEPLFTQEIFYRTPNKIIVYEAKTQCTNK
jgi:hypothetical protein